MIERIKEPETIFLRSAKIRMRFPEEQVGVPRIPCAVSSGVLLSPTQLPGSYVMCSRPLNVFPPLLIVVTMAAPPPFISTSLPSALTVISSFA